MEKVLEFFKNLPRKKCSKCGKEFDEKADCYGSLCDDCEDPAH